MISGGASGLSGVNFGAPAKPTIGGGNLNKMSEDPFADLINDGQKTSSLGGISSNSGPMNLSSMNKQQN